MGQQKNNKYHESKAKMYDYSKKPVSSNLPIKTDLNNSLDIENSAYENYLLTRSHLLKNITDESIREYIFLKSLLPIDHWFIQSVQGLSLEQDSDDLSREIDCLEKLG